ncbi:MAG: response regulator transcription factor [Saprospirales bacterium]|nr:response regulator transcription factor [Saprospirales bacterium]
MPEPKVEETPIRVGIVDDQRLFLDGISALLNTCKEVAVCCLAQSGDDAVAKSKEDCPEILLLDLSMPDRDGLEVLQQLQEEFPALRVIMLTVHDDFSSIQDCMQHGAMGYVLKINGKDELLRAIEEVHQGRKYLDPKVIDILLTPPRSGAQANSSKGAQGQGPGILTQREKELLQLLAEGKTSEVIASELFISVNTVDTHRKNIISKLGAKNITDAVRIAISRGLL